MEVDLVITPNGDRTVITPDNGEYYTKGELQGHLESGGLKLFRVEDGFMIANPDGAELGLPYNGDGANIIIDRGYNWDTVRGNIALVDASHIKVSELFNEVSIAEQ